MKNIFIYFIIFISSLYGLCEAKPSTTKPAANRIVTSTKRIYLPNYPGAYNPSIVKFNDSYLLIFRHLPDRGGHPWLSYIGVVLLDEFFEPISDTQLLDTRFNSDKTPSQSEDARVFSFNGKYYVIYNDNMDLTFPSIWDRRDMYIAELLYVDNKFILTDPVKLIHENKYSTVLWQKNWNPFEWDGKLLLSYTINPHEVIYPDLENGICRHFHETSQQIQWNLGPLRGSSPAQLVNGEYLAFFHSGTYTSSVCSNNRELWHYYMGAYTFSANPPFEITKISSLPINAPSFYTFSSYDKRVIYPGGFIVDDQNIYVAYGKDDSEIWIGTLNINALMQSLVPLNNP